MHPRSMDLSSHNISFSVRRGSEDLVNVPSRRAQSTLIPAPFVLPQLKATTSTKRAYLSFSTSTPSTHLPLRNIPSFASTTFNDQIPISKPSSKPTPTLSPSSLNSTPQLQQAKTPLPPPRHPHSHQRHYVHARPDANHRRQLRPPG